MPKPDSRPYAEALRRINAAVKSVQPELDLSRLNLTSLPPEIGRLTNLTTLYVDNNQLTSLPPEVGKLDNLMELYVSNNQLTSLPSEVVRLANLTILDLNNNRLASLPSEMRSLANLETLYLHENDDLGLPPEVLGPTLLEVGMDGMKPAKPAGILAYYFRRQAESKRRLNEAKLLLVGQGGVGKSSLVNYLVLKKRADPTEVTTEGIKISAWSATSRIRNEKIALNVWDFGGQEIMHATHQFFLTRRSLYLLVLDARKGENEGNLYYWLRIIASFGGDSPVIVVINQCDGPNDLNLNERRLAADFSNIQGFAKTSCVTGRGIAELRNMIEQQVNNLHHVFDELPESYFTIKTELSRLAKSRDYLDLRDYQKLCTEHGVHGDDEQERLLRFLHDLGAVLNFNDPLDPYGLRDTHILNPEWVTIGVYRILNSPALRDAGGVLDCAKLGDILGDNKAYPAERRTYIVGMMRRFELCFDFPDSNGGRVLVPERLPENEPPDLEWTAADALRFQYHYPALPGGVIPRFIVRTNHLLTKPPIYWRSGAVLEVEGVRVLVRGDTQTGRVFIVIPTGKGQTLIQRRQALSVLRDHFRAIHATIPRLDPAEKVPLPDAPSVVADYRHLLKLEARGIGEFLPEGADDMESVGKLLDGIESPAKRAEMREGDVNIFNNFNIDQSRSMHARDVGPGKRSESMSQKEGNFVKQVIQDLAGPASVAGQVNITVDQGRTLHARDIIGATVALGDIRESVTHSINRISRPDSRETKELQEVLEQLTTLLNDAPARGIPEQVAADALVEVKSIADAAQSNDPQILATAKKTIRTLSGFAGELGKVPALAAQFAPLVEHLRTLFH